MPTGTASASRIYSAGLNRSDNLRRGGASSAPVPRLFLDFAPRLVERLPALAPTSIRGRGGRVLALTRQRFIARLLEIDYTRARQHATHPTANAFHRRTLLAGMHVDSTGGRLAQVMRPVFEFPEGPWRFTSRRIGKPYTPKPEAREAFALTVESGVSFPAYLSYGDGSPFVAFADLPDAGIVGTAVETLNVPKLFPVDLAAVDAAIGELRQRSADAFPNLSLSDPPGVPNEIDRRRLEVVAAWVRSVGGIPCLSYATRHGRLVPVGPHPSAMRPAFLRLFAGSAGLVRYTLTHPHWAIYRCLARSIGFRTPLADDFTGDRSAWYAHWRKVTGVYDVAAFDRIAFTWLLGGDLCVRMRSAGAWLIGVEPLRRLSEDMATRALFEETQAGVRDVVRAVLRKESDGRTTVYVNALGRTLAPDSRRITFGRRCAHAFEGYAGWIMRRAAATAESVAAIAGDCLLAPKCDAAVWGKTLARESAERLGVTLRVEFAGEDV